MSWLGKKMMNPQGKIGTVIDDSNGLFRVLKVKFEDNTIEELWLANIGPNPERSHKWKWFFDMNGQEPHWVEWGR